MRSEAFCVARMEAIVDRSLLLEFVWELNSTAKLLFMEPGTELSKSAREIRGSDSSSKTAKDLEIEGYTVGGLSIGGHETCVIFPTLKVAFDIGRCPTRAVSQNFLLISHAHMDHIGGLPMYVATRGLYRMKPPTIIVPISVKEDVEKLFEIHRKMDQSELKHNLIGLDVGEEFYLRKDLKVKAFRTYHVIPSQGYILYSVKQKLKPEYIGLPGNEIKNLKLSGEEITYTLAEPEIAFTGDTMSDFIVDENNTDVLRARVLVLECTFLNDSITVEHAKDYGHTHLSEIISYAEKLQNRAILLIHFSARYTVEEINQAVSALPPSLAGRTFALTE
ncbi:tRNase Z TRZ1, partial [Mucuna pruriens]